ncbi:MAG TPA: aminopeptidase P family protein [Salinivirgaceae bacterium]|nr:aminopeptidase P family protein [Salinivirgaceae bacterium]
MFNAEVYKRRRSALRKQMTSGIALILGNSEASMNYPANTYHFRQDSNFLYFFGLDFPDFAGVIDFETGQDIIFADDLSIDDIVWMGDQPSVRERALLAGVENTRPFSKLAEYISEAIKKGKKVHFTPPYRAVNKMLLESLTGIRAAVVRDHASTPLIRAIIALRSVKEPCEIEELEKAAVAGYEMQVKAMKMAKVGRWEQTIAGTIEGISLAHGGVPSFPIILSQNGQILHNHSHNNILEAGRLVVCDCGAESLLHYASDHTRTTPVGGKFTDRQKEIYEIVLAANNATNKNTKPGITYQQVHLMACKIIAQGLSELGLMKGNVDDAVCEGAHALFMPHGLGHMIGLDVHDMEDLGQTLVGYDEETRPIKQFGTEALRFGRKLEPGFCLTNEPGIYFIPALIDAWKKENKHADFINYDLVEKYKDFGGIRLEDMLLVTESGCRIIGERPPITVEEVEAIAATE